MLRKVFSSILRILGLPLFLVEWILKTICFFSYNGVGLLYKHSFIKSSKAGKVSYILISSIFLVCIIALLRMVKN